MNTKLLPAKRQDRLLVFLFLAFLGVNYFYPAWITQDGLYFCTLLLANGAAGLFLLAAWKYLPRRPVKDRWLKALVVVIFLYLAVNLVVTTLYSRWYWDAFNKGISFVFMLTLAYRLDPDFIRRNRIIEAIILVAGLSSFCSILFFLAGYDAIELHNLRFQFLPVGGSPYYDDARLTWVYLHKSTHSTMLLLSSALTLRYFSKFRHKLLPLACLALFGIAMILSNTMAGIAGLALIYFGFFVNLILARSSKRMRILVWIIILLGGAAAIYVLYTFVGANRNLTTFGYRLPIWEGSLRLIRENPMGIGREFSHMIIWKDQDNCHNTFLNEIFRFSIPVGGMYIATYLTMMFGSLWRQKFFSLAVWGAFLFSINMDYALQAHTLTLVLVYLYFIFLYRDEPSND